MPDAHRNLLAGIAYAMRRYGRDQGGQLAPGSVATTSTVERVTRSPRL